MTHTPSVDHDLDALFKRLHLANARRVWRDLVQRAEREAWSYRDFLTLVASEEIAHRQQTRLVRLTRRAHFPFLKTIQDFGANGAGNGHVNAVCDSELEGALRLAAERERRHVDVGVEDDRSHGHY